mgnify:CR=1 FL=1
MKNILVVGGAGYIGSHNVRQLIKSGYNVVVYDNLSKGHIEAVKEINIVKGDICDKNKLKQTIEDNKIDAVMHFAAFIEVGESVLEPSKYYKNNVVDVITLLNVMVEAKIKYFVFSSTAAVFGEPVYTPIDEKHPKNPINPYGKTKLTVEEILKDYDRAYGLKYAVLRYFNAAGADDNSDIGESHTPETHLIPLILKTALGERESIKIYGNNYDTKDGTCLRDYIHVNDLASAHILALEKMFDTNLSDNFNLGSGEGFSVKEIIEKSKLITGIDFKVEEVEKREGDPAVLVADSKKAEKILGWTRKYTIEKIIETAWKWHKDKKY